MSCQLCIQTKIVDLLCKHFLPEDDMSNLDRDVPIFEKGFIASNSTSLPIESVSSLERTIMGSQLPTIP